MNFEDEPFVKLYTRDTVNWKRLEWQGRCVLMSLLRKVDRAGCLDLSESGIEGICAIVELPEEVTEVGIARCIKVGSVVIEGDQLRLPRFMTAQAARQSDRARARALRERRAAGLSRNEGKESRNVTDPSQDGHRSSLLDQKRSDQKNPPVAPPQGSPAPAEPPPSPQKETLSTDSPASLAAAWEALTAACPRLKPPKRWLSSTGLNPNEEGALARQWVDAQENGHKLADIPALADWIKAGHIAMRASPREYLCRNLCTALDDAAKWREEGKLQRAAVGNGANPRRIGTTSEVTEAKVYSSDELRAAADLKRSGA